MCGRFTLRRDIYRVRRELRIEARGGDVLFEPRYNIAPTDQVPILVRLESGARDLKPMTWGIPRSRNGRMVRQINARGESIGAGVARCAVISDGFYEWTAGKGSERQPYFFHRLDDELILLAAYWVWSDARGGGRQQTFTIITTAANTLMAPIHNRMPAILDEGDDLSLWLNPTSELKDLRGLLAPAPEGSLEMRHVSQLVNSVKNEGPELLQSVD